MFQVIAKLFPVPTSTKSAPQARLGVEGLEDRCTPTTLVAIPLVAHGFNPHPEPPGMPAELIASATSSGIGVHSAAGAVQIPISPEAGPSSVLATQGLVIVGG